METLSMKSNPSSLMSPSGGLVKKKNLTISIKGSILSTGANLLFKRGVQKAV